MSKDSSATYLHMHSPHLADLFEEFCRPPSSSTTPSSLPNQTPNPTSSSTSNPNPTNPQSSSAANNNNDNMVQLPGHFLPFEEIYLPPHLVPVNPEDEDDVVPDMHAAFGINRALGQGVEGAGAGGAGQAREPAWRDFGLEELVRRGPEGSGGVRVGVGRNRKEGKRSGLMMMR